MDLFPDSLAFSLSSLSATTTEQVMVVSVVLRGEKMSIEELEVEEELMEIRPPADMTISSESLQEKENTKSPLSTTLKSRLAEQVRVTSSTPPATKESLRTVRDTVGAETAANTGAVKQIIRGLL